MLRAAYANAGVAPGDGRLRRGPRHRHPRRRSGRARRPRRRPGRGRDPADVALPGRLGEDEHRPHRGRGRSGRPASSACSPSSTSEIPASLHLDEPNPAIPWDATCRSTSRRRRCRGRRATVTPRLAGVSAFGITGTNAHVVLEEAPAAGAVTSAAPTAVGALPLVLSAASPDALPALADRYAELLAGADGPDAGRRVRHGGAPSRRARAPRRVRRPRPRRARRAPPALRRRRTAGRRCRRPALRSTPRAASPSCSPVRAASGTAWPVSCWPASRPSRRRSTRATPRCRRARLDGPRSARRRARRRDLPARRDRRASSRRCSPSRSPSPRRGGRGASSRRRSSATAWARSARRTSPAR